MSPGVVKQNVDPVKKSGPRTQPDGFLEKKDAFEVPAFEMVCSGGPICYIRNDNDQDRQGRLLGRKKV